jgi:hypothetical protein
MRCVVYDSCVAQLIESDLPRRNVGLSDASWASVGAIAAKTGRSKSEVVEEAISRFVEVEEPKLFNRPAGRQRKDDKT